MGHARVVPRYPEGGVPVSDAPAGGPMSATPTDGLLPCPFCGGIAVMLHKRVGCTNPECYVDVGAASEQLAVIAWNRRAAPAVEAAEQRGYARGRAEALPVGAAGKMRLLADWFDADDRAKGRPATHNEVQSDLRAWADILDRAAHAQAHR